MSSLVPVARSPRAARHLRGQVSTELLIIVAVVLVIFIPMLILVYIKTGEANDSIAAYQAELACARLAYLANSIGSLGSNASVNADIYIPSSVTSISTKTVGRGGEIVFVVQTPAGASEIAQTLKYPVNQQDLPVQGGWARFDISSVYVGGNAQLLIVRGQ